MEVGLDVIWSCTVATGAETVPCTYTANGKRKRSSANGKMKPSSANGKRKPCTYTVNGKKYRVVTLPATVVEIAHDGPLLNHVTINLTQTRPEVTRENEAG